MDARGEGRLSLAEPVSGEFAISIEADAAAMQVEAEGRHQPDRIEIERLDVGADGLAIVASGTYSSGAWTGNLEADVSGTRFLAAWPGTDAIPEDLRAHLELEAGGEGTAVRPALLLAGAAPSTGLDSLHVVGYGRIDGPETDLRVDIRALVRDQFAIALDARALDLERPRLHVAPIVVRQRLDELADSPAPIPDGANVVIAPQERSVVIDGLRVTGGLGELRLDGKYTEPEGGDGRLVIEWPEPPTVLELAGFDAAERDTLLAPGWSQDGVPGIDARVRFGEGARSGSLDADIALPAPWSLVAGLHPPPTAPPTFAASQTARGKSRARGRRCWTSRPPHGSTAPSRMSTAREPPRSLDSMLIRGGPVRATAAAQLDSAEVDGKFQLDLVSHPALAMVVPDLPSDLQFLVNLRAGVAGSPQAPDARANPSFPPAARG